MPKKSRKTGAVPGLKAPAKSEKAVVESRPSGAAGPAQVPGAQKAVGPARPAAPAAPAPVPAPAPSQEEIRRLAHQIWEQRGRPQGQDIDIWCEAERRLTRKA